MAIPFCLIIINVNHAFSMPFSFRSLFQTDTVIVIFSLCFFTVPPMLSLPLARCIVYLNIFVMLGRATLFVFTIYEKRSTENISWFFRPKYTWELMFRFTEKIFHCVQPTHCLLLELSCCKFCAKALIAVKPNVSLSLSVLQTLVFMSRLLSAEWK